MVFIRRNFNFPRGRSSEVIACSFDNIYVRNANIIRDIEKSIYVQENNVLYLSRGWSYSNFYGWFTKNSNNLHDEQKMFWLERNVCNLLTFISHIYFRSIVIKILSLHASLSRKKNCVVIYSNEWDRIESVNNWGANLMFNW